ncbi:MAG: capsid cement protein [bacterium]
MSTHNKTYQPLQLLTVTAGEDLPACRFVNYSGSLCDEDTMAFGVTEIDWLDEELASVVSLGTVVVESSEAILAGANVAADTNGKAKTAGELSVINGRAIDACSGAGYIKIKLVP